MHERSKVGTMCAQLHAAVRHLSVSSFPADVERLPRNGIYLTYEKDETGHGGQRIVRIGSHTGSGKLPARLNEHTTKNKDRSIFRKHIGRALLKWQGDPFLEQWEWDLTSRKNRAAYEGRLDSGRQQEVEDAVTRRIVDSFSFSVFEVVEQKLRLSLEGALIATVAQCPDCHASQTWLGKSSPAEPIRTSGIWNMQQLKGEPLSEELMARLEQLISR